MRPAHPRIKLPGVWRANRIVVRYGCYDVVLAKTQDERSFFVRRKSKVIYGPENLPTCRAAARQAAYMECHSLRTPEAPPRPPVVWTPALEAFCRYCIAIHDAKPRERFLAGFGTDKSLDRRLGEV